MQNGCQHFIHLGEHTMELTEIMRQNKEEKEGKIIKKECQEAKA